MRFSILTLLVLVAYAAVGCVALTSVSVIWAALLATFAAVALCFAFVAAIMLRGRQQAFWIGFVSAGLLYQYLINNNGLAEDALLTDIAAAMDIKDDFLSMEYGYQYTEFDVFNWSAQSLFQILLAYGGGLVARYCYGLRQKQEAGIALQSR